MTKNCEKKKEFESFAVPRIIFPHPKLLSSHLRLVKQGILFDQPREKEKESNYG